MDTVRPDNFFKAFNRIETLRLGVKFTLFDVLELLHIADEHSYEAGREMDRFDHELLLLIAVFEQLFREHGARPQRGLKFLLNARIGN